MTITTGGSMIEPAVHKLDLDAVETAAWRITQWMHRFPDTTTNEEAMTMFLAAVAITSQDVPLMIAEIRTARSLYPSSVPSPLDCRDAQSR